MAINQPGCVLLTKLPIYTNLEMGNTMMTTRFQNSQYLLRVTP